MRSSSTVCVSLLCPPSAWASCCCCSQRTGISICCSFTLWCVTGRSRKRETETHTLKHHTFTLARQETARLKQQVLIKVKFASCHKRSIAFTSMLPKYLYLHRKIIYVGLQIGMSRLCSTSSFAIYRDCQNRGMR